MKFTVQEHEDVQSCAADRDVSISLSCLILKDQEVMLN
jgi:hypothetical protein